MSTTKMIAVAPLLSGSGGIIGNIGGVLAFITALLGSFPGRGVDRALLGFWRGQ